MRTIELLRANAILSPSEASFRALAYAEGEAYLRFPGALNAIQWLWDRAYNLIRIHDPQALSFYANLITTAITSGSVRSSDLSTWFTQFETRLTLQISSLPPQPGELARELIEITGDGSAYFWLVESPNGTSIYPLINDVDFNQPHENAFLYDELTGDRSPELVIYRRTSPGTTQLLQPHIFDLSASPPIELPIRDQVPINFGLESITEVETGTSEVQGNHFHLINKLMPACPTHVIQEYIWNGEIFTISPPEYLVIPIINLLEYCEIVINEASSRWSPEAAISVSSTLLEVWPPVTDTRGHPYPADAYDQLRYRLGVLYALANHPSETNRIMDEIIHTTIVTNSTWVALAQEFLIAYQTPDDVFTACQQSQYCNHRDALRTIVKYSATDDPVDALVYLQRNGLTTRSSGVFDFDKDGQDERWMIIQPKPGDKLEFWILVHTLNGIQAVFVQVFEASESLPYYHEPAGLKPVVQFELHKGFILNRIEDTREAYIEWVDVEYARPTIIRDGYYLALHALLDGADPMTVRESLLELFNSPRFIGDCIAFRICDQFHYTLGLVYNLTGEEGNAIDEYLWVWRNYGQSPYAILARLKLDYFPLPTYTQPAVPSRTPTSTRTPTVTATSTP